METLPLTADDRNNYEVVVEHLTLLDESDEYGGSACIPYVDILLTRTLEVDSVPKS